MRHQVSRKSLAFLVGSIALVQCTGLPQESISDTLSHEHTSITIQTDVDSAIVIINSKVLGVTPLTIDTLTPGWHRLVLLHPDLYNWLAGAIADSFHVHPGETRTLRYGFEPRFLLASAPHGAEVFIRDSLAGTTPLVLKGRHSVRHVTIRKEGYNVATADLLSGHRGILNVAMERAWHSESENGWDGEGSEGSSSLRLYITGAATVLSGAAAAYFKVRADNQYNQYIRTGDPAFRSETRRLDTAAAIALAATQVGLGLFTYFILTE